MLETIREYAHELLAQSREEDELYQRHAALFVELAESAYARAGSRAETHWADALEADLDNLRAALDRLEGDETRYLQLAGALGWFFHLHSRLTEGAERLDKALSTDGDARHRARALTGAGTIAGWLGRTSTARERLEAAIAIWHALDEPVEAALAHEALGWTLFAAGEDTESLQAFENALALQREHGTPLLVNRALVGVCQDLVALGDIEAAEPRAHELLELARREDGRPVGSLRAPLPRRLRVDPGRLRHRRGPLPAQLARGAPARRRDRDELRDPGPRNGRGRPRPTRARIGARRRGEQDLEGDRRRDQRPVLERAARPLPGPRPGVIGRGRSRRRLGSGPRPLVRASRRRSPRAQSENKTGCRRRGFAAPQTRSDRSSTLPKAARHSRAQSAPEGLRSHEVRSTSGD